MLVSIVLIYLIRIIAISIVVKSIDHGASWRPMDFHFHLRKRSRARSGVTSIYEKGALPNFLIFPGDDTSTSPNMSLTVSFSLSSLLFSLILANRLANSELTNFRRSNHHLSRHSKTKIAATPKIGSTIIIPSCSFPSSTLLAAAPGTQPARVGAPESVLFPLPGTRILSTRYFMNPIRMMAALLL